MSVNKSTVVTYVSNLKFDVANKIYFKSLDKIKFLQDLEFKIL